MVVVMVEELHMWFEWLIVVYFGFVVVLAVMVHHAPKVEVIRPFATIVLVGGVVLLTLAVTLLLTRHTF